MPSNRKLAAFIVVCVLLCCAIVACGNAMDRGRFFGFDGYLFEPGCDWGNPRCEREDYRAMCAQYDGSVKDAYYVRWCAGRRW